MKQIRIAVAALMLLMGSIFGSCTKDTAQEGQQSSPKSILQSIPSYSSMEEVYDIIETATSFENVNDLAEYEEMAGRESIGRLADVFYSNVNYEDFTSQEEAITFCLENAQYIDTIVSPNGDISVTPKWENSPYRYVANKDGLFRVGDRVYRLFKHEEVSTNIKNIAMLLSINENNLCNLDYTIFFSSSLYTSSKSDPHRRCKPSGVTYSDTAWGSPDDILVLQLFTHVDPSPIEDDPTLIFSARVKFFNRHNWLGIWWTCQHSVTCTGSLKTHFDEFGNDNWAKIPDTVNYNGSCNSHFISTCVSFGDLLSQYHFYSYNISATVPGFTTATLLNPNLP